MIFLGSLWYINGKVISLNYNKTLIGPMKIIIASIIDYPCETRVDKKTVNEVLKAI